MLPESNAKYRTAWLPRETGSALAVITAVVLLWLWPVGLGGKMPVGGDVTGFSVGLMAFFQRALRSGCLPLWNDLWGYGFPGVGESQMGVFYPLHWLLYGCLSLERAYTLSLVFHSLWAALGAFWSARRMEISAGGAALAAVAFSTCGFFLIHVPHQWGYTVGSWMPWACGLAWEVAHGSRARSSALLLAAVLAIQTLPGHFQLAFETQLLVLLIGVYGLVHGPRGERAKRDGLTLLAIIATAPLAAAQIVPTARLAALAQSQRDFEFLSGFAATPLHLVSFVAPGLFHKSPLWRPLVWDPFHTSPEEYLGYIGLVPFVLAACAAFKLWKREPSVRCWAALTIVTVLLSLGPYCPGFSPLWRLPGFSFFRAPARWGLATSLGLAILAGKGWDFVRAEPSPAGRSLRPFIVAVALWFGIVVAVIEGGFFLATESPGSALARACDRVLAQLPWDQDPSLKIFAAAARAPQSDIRVRSALARQGVVNPPRAALRWDRMRGSIYRDELAGTLFVLGALASLVTAVRRPPLLLVGLGLLTGADILVLNHHRNFDFGPVRSLVGQSPVLAELAAVSKGERVASSLRNLPMVAGAGTLVAYRTLDLPAVPLLTQLTLLDHGNAERADLVKQALRATGTKVRVLDPDRTLAQREVQNGARVVTDPVLAGWFNGRALAAHDGEGGAQFRIEDASDAPTIAWFVAGTLADRAISENRENRNDAAVVLPVIANARPCDFRSDRPEHVRVELETGEPGVIILSRLHDPLWRATLERGGIRQTATVDRVFGTRGAGAWQAITLPGAGRWTVDLVYSGSDVWLGLAVSGAAWVIWGALFWRAHRAATTTDKLQRDGK
jgi:hypothetical protein